jgi:hypothetical protein
MLAVLGSGIPTQAAVKNVCTARMAGPLLISIGITTMGRDNLIPTTGGLTDEKFLKVDFRLGPKAEPILLNAKIKGEK